MKTRLIIFSILISSTTLANRIMPEISKDGKTRHKSSMAVANDRRQFFNTQFKGGSADIANVDAVDSSDFDIDGAFANRVFSAEFSYNDTVGFTETQPIQSEIGHNREALLLLGFRPIDAISFGLGYRNIERDLDNNFNSYDIEASAVYNINNNVSLAGAYRYNKASTQRDGHFNSYTFGAGYQDEVLSAEAGAIFKANSLAQERGDLYEFFIGATRKYHDFEFDTDIEYEFGDIYYVSGDYTRMKFNFDVEYLFTKYLYVTPGVDYRKLEIDNTSSEQLYTSLDFGYREAGMDVTFGIDYLADGTLKLTNQDIELDQWRITLGMGYFF